MDREINEVEIRKQNNKRFVWIAVAVVVVVAGIWFLRGTLKNSVKRSEIRLAVAEVGPIENTLSATGEIQPEFEQVITSPITAIIQNVYLDAGAVVKAGDKILELDKTITELDLSKQKTQLEQKKNNIVKQKWDLEKNYYDLKINDSIKGLKINSLKADLENAKRLHKAGGGTREAIEQAELNLKIAVLEKRQLENDIKVKQQTIKADIKDSELSSLIQSNDLSQLEYKLKNANIVANRSGVLTFVNKNLGVKVNEGEVLVRLADLKGFRLIGSVSDTYADKIKVGMGVIVRINDEILKGELVNIQPSVQNNILRFDVSLNDKSNKLLRPNMKVEVYLVTDAKSKTIRVANGAAFGGASVQDVFVLRKDGKAERRTLKIGLTNFDFVEILDGINAGETVIISDLSKYKNATELEIQQ
ncbi:MAG: efflux RND transporter periplasmic adaptor subunit [Spirosomataceae bacterium]